MRPPSFSFTKTTYQDSCLNVDTKETTGPYMGATPCTPLCVRHDRNLRTGSSRPRTKIGKSLLHVMSPAGLNAFSYKCPHSIPIFLSPASRALFFSAQCITEYYNKLRNGLRSDAVHANGLDTQERWGLSAKLLTESNSTLSMNIVNMVTLRLENDHLLFHPHNNSAIFQPQYPLHTIWKTAFARPSGQLSPFHHTPFRTKL